MQHAALRAHVKAHIVPLCLGCSAPGNFWWQSGYIRLQGLYTTLQFCKSSFLCFKLPTVCRILPANPRDQTAGPEASGRANQTTTWYAHREEQRLTIPWTKRLQVTAVPETIQVKSKTSAKTLQQHVRVMILSCRVFHMAVPSPWTFGSSIIGSSPYLSSRQNPKNWTVKMPTTWTAKTRQQNRNAVAKASKTSESTCVQLNAKNIKPVTSSNSWHQLHNSEWTSNELKIPKVFNWQWTARTTSYQLLQWTASAKALHDSFCSGSYLGQLLFLLGSLL